MKKISKIVDTNVILRFLVEDQPKQFNQAKIWFKQAKRGKFRLVVEPIVIAEGCYVLESFYKIDRVDIADKLQVLLGQRWLKVSQRKVLENLWPFYLQGLHFLDSFLLSWSKVNNQQVLSFDQELKKVWVFSN